MTTRSRIVVMLWEIWRVTRVEAALKLAFGIVGGLAVLALSATFAPADNARRYEDVMDNGAAIAMTLLVLPHLVSWLSLARLNGGRPGFPLYLHYTRPVRTAVLVGLPMVYLTAVSSAIYLMSALLLRVTSGYAFPLLPVAAWIAALTLVFVAATWSTRDRTVQVLVMDDCHHESLGVGHGSPYRSGDPGHLRLASASVADAVRLPAHRLRVDRSDWLGIFRRHGRRSYATASRRRMGGGTLGATRRILGPARQLIPFPVSHLVFGAGSGLVGPEVQRIAGADDRSDARDRDSAGVGGQRAHRCCDQCGPSCVLPDQGMLLRPSTASAPYAALFVHHVVPRRKCLRYSPETRTRVHERIRGDSCARHRTAGRP